MMIKSSLIQQSHLLPTLEIPTSNSRVRFKEQSGLPVQKCKSLEEFKQAHAQILKLGLHQNIYVLQDLVAACALSTWVQMDYAFSIFHQIDDPTTFLYNIMIRGYVRDSNPKAALFLYREMMEIGIKPDNFTYTFVVKGCSHLSSMVDERQIHGHVIKFGSQCDIYVQNSLISMYGRDGKVELALKMFKQMEERSVASWSSVIAAHTKLGKWDESMNLFGEMIAEGWRPDESTYVSGLSSCSHLGALHWGRSIHGSLIRNICGHNIIVETTLVDFYVRCGSLQKGLCVFYNMPQKNILSYSVMISGMAMHGEGERALWVFSDMLKEGLSPDETVFVGVLAACSHTGLIDEGLKWFNKMRFEHGLEPTIQHYGCMVDLLSRAGRLEDAYELIKSMPIVPNDVVWRSLLSACKVHSNLELGEIAAKHLLHLDSHKSGDYVLLSNLYAVALQWENVARVRKDMVLRGQLQEPGFSMIEVKKKVHKFFSQDKAHPESDEIYEMLYQMGWQLRFEGYSPDTSQVLFNENEEEKKRLVGAHSQKLAIAYGLIHTSKGLPIRIVKNLRMCKDCHTFTKLISYIYDQDIVVRDRYRFHHFREGNCSCRDYW